MSPVDPLLGYKGRAEWLDMSDYLVHLTRSGQDAYNSFLSILGSGILKPGPAPFGAARYRGESHRSVCFSEVPLGFLTRFMNRRSTMGVAFKKTLAVEHGCAPVWYVHPGTAPFEAVGKLIHEAEQDGDANAAIWSLTPFIDHPSPAYKYEFEWEREWRHVGAFGFKPGDVAFLLLEEENHSAASTFFADAEAENTGPNYTCPYIDPRWSTDQVLNALKGIEP